jgi:cytochrome b subunit of formate dehydrogenase
LLLAGLWIWGASLQAQPAAGADCSSCHEQGQKLATSAHEALACNVCHDQHESYPHPEGVAKPACATCHAEISLDYQHGVHGQAAQHGDAGAPDCATCHGGAHELLRPQSTGFRSKMPETCGMCHTETVEQFRSSVHGKALERGVAQAPLCTDCHGEHSILKHTNASSPVNAGHIRETCGSCHGDVRLSRKFGMPDDRIVSFDSSFHGLAAQAGVQTVANCASCHGVHNILPSSDPQSTVHPKKLATTCGSCHPGAGKRFAISQVHVAEGRGEPAVMRWVRQFYYLLIPLLIGLMALHQGGDWVRKAIRLRKSGAPPVRRARPARPEIRMYPLERFQHALLVLSFAVLVWTGFALKYPDQWWARPLLIWEGTGSMRGLVHRIAAVVFMGVAALHLITLLASPRLRHHWKEMWPNRRDPVEALQNFAYNVGLLSRRPARSSHSYVEKAEYWAVVWGAVIMIATGLMLWANNLMLAFLPKLWLDVATAVHFYEAVLATLAIVVWHFYSVIFDPDVYPMETAWMTGVSVKEHEPAATAEFPERSETHGAAKSKTAEPAARNV